MRPTDDEFAEYDKWFADTRRIDEIADKYGLKPVAGCCCHGSNVPEYRGYCPCQGIDNRPEEAKRELGAAGLL